MTKGAGALLALWNSCSAGPEEYNLWHTREHVLERLTIDGFLSARRYVKVSGHAPEYLTLYWLTEVAVLKSQAYRALLDEPSDWSRRMRARLTDLTRRACQDVTRAGGGIGGDAAVKIVRFDAFMAQALTSYLDERCPKAVTSLTLARFAADVPGLPFGVEAHAPANDGEAFLLVEGFDAGLLEDALARIDEDLELTASPGSWSTYRLAFIATKEDAVAPARGIEMAEHACAS